MSEKVDWLNEITRLAPAGANLYFFIEDLPRECFGERAQIIWFETRSYKMLERRNINGNRFVLVSKEIKKNEK